MTSTPLGFPVVPDVNRISATLLVLIEAVLVSSDGGSDLATECVSMNLSIEMQGEVMQVSN